jgi:hypothetical protein
VHARLHEKHIDEDRRDGDRPDRKCNRVSGAPSEEAERERDYRLSFCARACPGAAAMTSFPSHAVAISSSTQRTHRYVHARDFWSAPPFNLNGACQRPLKRTLSAKSHPQALFTIHFRGNGPCDARMVNASLLRVAWLAIPKRTIF